MAEIKVCSACGLAEPFPAWHYRGECTNAPIVTRAEYEAQGDCPFGIPYDTPTDQPNECQVSLVSSRMCEHGTKGCEVKHA